MTQTVTSAPTQTGGKILAILLVIGGPIVSFIALICIVAYFLSQGVLPIAALGSWNLLIGFIFWLLGTVALIVGIVILIMVKRSSRRAA